MHPRTSRCPNRPPSRPPSTAAGTATASRRRLPRPVPVGVRVEHRLRRGLQPQRPPPSARSCRPQSARPESSSRHATSVSPPPAPEAGSTSPTTSGSRSCTGCPSDPSRTPPWTPRPPRRALVGLDPLVCLPHFQLRDIERLAWRLQLAHSTPPRTPPVDRTNKPRTTRPLRSAPITGASPLLRAGPPANPATVLSPSRFPPLGTLPLAPHRLQARAVSGHAFPVPRREPQTGLASPPCRTPPGQ